VLGYIVRRVLWIIPVLFFVSVITFSMMHLAPGGPWAREKHLLQATVDLLNVKYGLTDPVPIQYLRWVGGLLTGDLGPSYKYIDRGVNTIVADGIGTTVHLGVMAFLLSIVVGIPLGVIGALRHNKLPDYLATFVSVIGIATPSFVASILLLVFFSVVLKWFPTHGWDGWANPKAMVLPTVALALYPIAQISRFTRASMLEVTHKDYIRTAQSKGLRERTIVVVHMIRNALIPVVTILGPLLAFLITGSFIIETIFSVPGIGRYYVISIGQRDYGVIMAMTMLYAAAIATLNLVVDVLYAYIDPRIRYS
jgi:oligopeptide transport system permease protein